MIIVWVGGKIWTDFFSKKFEWYPGTSIPNHDMVKLCVRSEYRGNSRMNTKANVEIIVYISIKKIKQFSFILDADKNICKFLNKKFVNKWATQGTCHFPNDGFYVGIF